MNKNKNILVVIPARKGSKRLPKKNRLDLAGKPLIEWTIDATIEANLDCCIIVSSDDLQVLKIAENYRSYGVISHKRPTELGSDNTETADVLVDALKKANNAGHNIDTIILLQPTSPLREASDILKAINIYKKLKTKLTVTSVCKVEHPTAWVGTIDCNGFLDNINFNPIRSQDYNNEYRLNGAIYIIPAYQIEVNNKVFTQPVVPVEMPIERSIDIDEKFDLEMCEFLVHKKNCTNSKC